MAEANKIAIELDDVHYAEVCREAGRLGLSVEVLAQRAIAAYIIELEDDHSTAEGTCES